VLISLLLLPAVLALPQASCHSGELERLDAARMSSLRGDEFGIERLLQPQDGEVSCDLMQLARLARRAWIQARALAAVAGAADQMAPVQSSLSALQKFRESTPLNIEAEYAEIVARAAVAAAQDERPEMELLLTHARDLAERLLSRGRRAEWPLSFNLVAGELWFEVDRYQDALVAYERAVQAGAPARALVGLARAQARLDRIDDACATWARVKNAAPALRQLAAKDLARCR
jgi:hypothetical protein